MEKLTVYQLKCELRRRGKRTTGNKADLVCLLKNELENEGLDFERWATLVQCQNAVEDTAFDTSSQVSAGSCRTRCMDKIEITANDNDGISQCSVQSSASAAEIAKLRRIEEDATRAGLEAKVKVMLEKQHLDKKIYELARQKELLEVTEAIEIAKGRANVLIKHEDDDAKINDMCESIPKHTNNINQYDALIGD